MLQRHLRWLFCMPLHLWISNKYINTRSKSNYRFGGNFDSIVSSLKAPIRSANRWKYSRQSRLFEIRHFPFPLQFHRDRINSPLQVACTCVGFFGTAFNFRISIAAWSTWVLPLLATHGWPEAAWWLRYRYEADEFESQWPVNFNGCC